ncbi:MAG: class I SAM-dependent methyltransferase [Candidatus Methanomethyliaceae archaeon]
MAHLLLYFKIIKGLTQIGLSVISFVLSPLFTLIAKTGYGSDICWRLGFLPLPVHYYSPVPDKAKLRRLNWQRAHDMPGISFNFNKQVELLYTLGRQYGYECAWPERPESGQAGYYWDNPSFGFSSACILHCFIRAFKPSKVIEVGAGYSTLIIAGALEMNRKETGFKSEFITFDPYPRTFLLSDIPGLTRLVQRCVEDVAVSEFESLQGGDILFIDSSHIVRIGGDVNYLYLDVLPRLRSGVIVHVHDVYFPYEYPSALYMGAKKYFWTEQYLLQAFLCFNQEYEVLLAAYWLQLEHPEIFASAFPNFNPSRHRPSSSFYMRRV